MGIMEMIVFMLAIMVFVATTEISTLKRRVDQLEKQLTHMEGTDYHQDRQDLIKVIDQYRGQSVSISLKEDYTDVELVLSSQQSDSEVTVIDVDSDWLHLKITDSTSSKEKLIRMEAVASVQLDVAQ